MGTWRVDPSFPHPYLTDRTLVYTTKKQTSPESLSEKTSYLFTIHGFSPMALSLHKRLHLWSSSIKPLRTVKAGGSLMDCSQLTLNPMVE